ncbi:MAG TPA: hypothetical protein VGS01_11525 [Candidatus Limnocylindria bacterium]|jgi:hypothetical protein|nr:hypothetical protein [Candidatus Limnocylindria bacterium]
MRRHRDGERSALVRDTIMWIAVVAWLAWSYVIQIPPGGPYSDALQNAFLALLAVVIPVISAIFVAAWITTLRNHRES